MDDDGFKRNERVELDALELRRHVDNWGKQSALAATAGISPRSLSNWLKEDPQNPPKAIVRTLRKLAKVLNVSISDLVIRRSSQIDDNARPSVAESDENPEQSAPTPSVDNPDDLIKSEGASLSDSSKSHTNSEPESEAESKLVAPQEIPVNLEPNPSISNLEEAGSLDDPSCAASEQVSAVDRTTPPDGENPPQKTAPHEADAARPNDMAVTIPENQDETINQISLACEDELHIEAVQLRLEAEKAERERLENEAKKQREERAQDRAKQEQLRREAEERRVWERTEQERKRREAEEERAREQAKQERLRREAEEKRAREQAERERLKRENESRRKEFRRNIAEGQKRYDEIFTNTFWDFPSLQDSMKDEITDNMVNNLVVFLLLSGIFVFGFGSEASEWEKSLNFFLKLLLCVGYALMFFVAWIIGIGCAYPIKWTRRSVQNALWLSNLSETYLDFNAYLLGYGYDWRDRISESELNYMILERFP